MRKSKKIAILRVLRNRRKQSERDQELIRLADAAQDKLVAEAIQAEKELVEKLNSEKKKPKNALKEIKKEEAKTDEQTG